jgi:DnaK suppressor protein
MQDDIRLSSRVVRSRCAQTLERLLRRNEDELIARKQLLRDDIAAEAAKVRDSAESCSDSFAEDVGAAILEVTARTVQGIEDALRRLATGRYGSCADCGRRIPPQRLRAVPFAARCRDCQQECDLQRRLPLPA